MFMYAYAYYITPKMLAQGLLWSYYRHANLVE